MNALQLYNSLTRQKERFIPLKANEVGMYVCGMTVYDYCHIGHARVMVVFDTIARHLRAEGYALRYVRNITDIDDKIIRRAAENGEDIAALTARFIAAMHEDEAALGCQRPDLEPRATDNISGMILLIARLLDSGHAYQGASGDIYYAIERFPQYGQLANQNLAALRAGERIEVDDEKREPLDFVLWKRAKAGEPSWPAPWGDGRPGWHIECSAMSMTTLGSRFDLHGGGMDLKFPHHECEIAQSEGAVGHPVVNYWLHNGFVQIDNEKMSKSLGNFFTVREVLNHYDGEILRYFILASHYRGPLNYSDQALREARKALARLYTALECYPQQNEGQLLPEYAEAFATALNDDFNTPKALAVLFELVRALNRVEDETALDLAYSLRVLAGRLGLLQRTLTDILRRGEGDIDEDSIEALIRERAEAKKNRDFGRADAIRDTLWAAGVAIKDTPEGTTWQLRL